MHFLKEHNIDARRGQQYKGTSDSPDVISEMKFVHWEVKRTEKLRLYKYLNKATQEAKTKIPIVAYRKNKEKWVCILDAEIMLDILRRYRNY